MKVLMISGDKNLLHEGSEAYARLQLQKAQVERLDVFVWPQVSSWSEILRAARTGHYDVVTAQDPFWRGLVGWCAARSAGATLQLQVHTDFTAEVAKNPLRYLLARFLLRRADSIRVVSLRIKKQVEPLALQARISVLPIYVDIERVISAAPANLEVEYPQLKNKKIILVVARLEPEKNVAAAIAVMAQVHKKISGVAMVIAGQGSQEQVLKRQVTQLGLENTVVFVGYRSDIASIYKDATVLLVTSKFESYGASIIEALAAGIPVVSPDVGVAREAGAIIVSRGHWEEAILDVLNSDKKGELKLSLLNKVEWAVQWRHTL